MPTNTPFFPLNLSQAKKVYLEVKSGTKKKKKKKNGSYCMKLRFFYQKKKKKLFFWGVFFYQMKYPFGAYSSQKKKRG